MLPAGTCAICDGLEPTMINEYFDFIMPPIRWMFNTFKLEMAKPQEMLIVVIWGFVIVPLVALGALVWLVRALI